uniref:Uncharacterized protein n=1 Tax=Arundo donax TaxID=35708 RepID=A0A0A9CC34_ARUDO
MAHITSHEPKSTWPIQPQLWTKPQSH